MSREGRGNRQVNYLYSFVFRARTNLTQPRPFLAAIGIFVLNDRENVPTFHVFRTLVPRSTQPPSVYVSSTWPDAGQYFPPEQSTQGASTHREQSAIMLSRPYSLNTLILLALLVVLLVGTQGAAKKVIVDDVDTRILYSSGGWATQATCPSCFPRLDKNKVHDGTWHFSKYARNFNLLAIVTSCE